MIISRRLLTFGAVGLINTSVDAGLFTLLHTSGVSIFAANLVSTSAGLAVSMLLHTRFTFKGNRMTKQRLAKFLAVTLAGLWLLQPVVIALITRIGAASLVINVFGHEAVLASLVPKLMAIGCTLIWNYGWYSRYVYA